ncbi:hypothetical protein [Streptomyces sp. cg35]
MTGSPETYREPPWAAGCRHRAVDAAGARTRDHATAPSTAQRRTWT